MRLVRLAALVTVAILGPVALALAANTPVIADPYSPGHSRWR